MYVHVRTIVQIRRLLAINNRHNVWQIPYALWHYKNCVKERRRTKKGIKEFDFLKLCLWLFFSFLLLFNKPHIFQVTTWEVITALQTEKRGNYSDLLRASWFKFGHE